MQNLAKSLVAAILGWQVRRLQKKNHFKVVAVAGSIGKTSTKLAIAQVLESKLKVRYQEGNYNDLISVPLVYFGHDFEESDKLPFLKNPISWLKIIRQNEKVIRQPYEYDVVVVELGSDAPGQLPRFKSYIKASYGVLTAITPEHMEGFGDMEAVAKEEMTIAQLSRKLFYNAHLVDKKYLNGPAETYDLKPAKDMINLKSELQFYSASAAIVIARAFGFSDDDIEASLKNIKGMKGRMQFLPGINKSTIIDDSYNASPAAVKAALQTLYDHKATQRIALLGNMNELGGHSEAAHKEIGALCDPKKVDLVVTLGPDSNKFIAPAAESKGCMVKSFESPYDAGEYIKSQIKSGAAILIKGSQNRVFSEEAIKPLLANPADAEKLVRQSADWLKIKQEAFKT